MRQGCKRAGEKLTTQSCSGLSYCHKSPGKEGKIKSKNKTIRKRNMLPPALVMKRMQMVLPSHTLLQYDKVSCECSALTLTVCSGQDPSLHLTCAAELGSSWGDTGSLRRCSGLCLAKAGPALGCTTGLCSPKNSAFARGYFTSLQFPFSENPPNSSWPKRPPKDSVH